MEADAPFDFMVCYSPDDPYVCVEPVSNATDAFNLAESGRTDTGMAVLQPGEVLRGVVRLRPEIDGVTVARVRVRTRAPPTSKNQC